MFFLSLEMWNLHIYWVFLWRVVNLVRLSIFHRLGVDRHGRQIGGVIGRANSINLKIERLNFNNKKSKCLNHLRWLNKIKYICKFANRVPSRADLHLQPACDGLNTTWIQCQLSEQGINSKQACVMCNSPFSSILNTNKCFKKKKNIQTSNATNADANRPS